MIQTKRDSLEKFIRAQMLGPGACLNHYFIKNEADNEDDSAREVLNTTPGAVYSTGVLFPQRKSADSTDAQANENQTKDGINDPEDTDDDNNGEGLEELINRSQSDDEDLFSLSQRFPTTIGLSFCIEKESTLSNKDLSISISGRYYRKVSKENCTSIVINIEDEKGFEMLYSEFINELSSFFSYADKQLQITHNFEKEIADVKDRLNEINQKLCKKIATNEDGSLDSEYNEIGGDYRFLKSYKERLWRRLTSVRNGIYPAAAEKDSVSNRIKNVEAAETFISYLEDAMNICNTKSFGYWVCESFCAPIDLSKIDLNVTGRRIIYSPKKYPSLNGIVSFPIDANGNTASLSVWIQILNAKNADKKKKYIKVQLENTSTPFQEDKEHYFSIVTEKVNQRSFFGVEIKVTSPLLAPYKDVMRNNAQSDVKALNYLYRSIYDYGVGHSCSVDWHITDDIRWVKTDFIPSYETPDVEAIPRDKHIYIQSNLEYIPKPLLETSEALQFKWLSTFSDATNSDVISGLYKFIEAYKSWIDKLTDYVSSQPEHDKKLGEANISECLKDYNRMHDNVYMLLENNPDNITSFRLMNSAMFIQLWHSKFNNDRKTNFDFYRTATDHIFGDFPATWRPFQLAFILLNLDGIIQRPDDPQWNYRNELVDLVWFPTGGGKTEAYLGIIALTIIQRRRTEHYSSGGTTAIMRYTLRLLATQQFQRAMRVIFALELLRRWNIYNLGNEAISIGLYVGDNSLPNKASDLLSECLKWNDMAPDGKRKASKIPLDKCPCCGRPLKYINQGTDVSPDIKFRCDNIRCNFSTEIPVKLCDEYIYKEPPTLLFGTVDKFAAIGHRVSSKQNRENQDSRRIFGKELNNLPPALIIQDELHLLLGPLGSAVSLFECAIDQLCTYTKNINGNLLKIRPKIISSTATTRNTEFQIRALYDRAVSIFPKPGVDYDDSFFSFYQRKKSSLDDNASFVSKRKYIGILPTGRTQMTTQMRLVATMFVHRALFERQYVSRLHEKDVETTFDYYHSVIDYFNSLKEIGKTDAQFFTEFTKYTRRLFKRVLRYDNMLECLYCYDSAFKKSELTGRLSGSEVVRELDIVGQHWSADNRFPHQAEDDNLWVPGTTPPDLILATNMISVGLDVDRFNTIIMNSMPRNVAEYIQASSRVARNKKGLVVTLYNPFRMRDMSHFERFKEFHEKLYYYVEPISITPFSKKSVMRYLPLYLATMIRHSNRDLADAESAADLNEEKRTFLINNLKEYFKTRLERTKKLSPYLRELLTTEQESFIEEFIEKALNDWLNMVKGQALGNYKLRYSGSELLNSRSKTMWKDLFISLDAYQDDDTAASWAVPMSLRTVESEAVINVKEEL